MQPLLSAVLDPVSREEAVLGTGDFEERVLVLRDGKRRIAAAATAIIVAFLGFVSLVRAFAGERSPAEPNDIFAPIHGWIAFGNKDGIWAVNPTPGRGAERLRLSDQPGEPLAWSADGSKLLIERGWRADGTAVFRPSILQPGVSIGLVVLHADGTETPAITLATASNILFGSSLSPDGSQVVYANVTRDSSISGIYVVDAQGGTPRLLHRPSGFSGVRGWPGMVYSPSFSPDGTKIAYFSGGGDHNHSLVVMNADGTKLRVLIGPEEPPVNPHANHVSGLVWSPDGSSLAFDVDYPWRIGGIWVIGADGSRLGRVIPGGATPSWSPDGSRIAYRDTHALYLANRDGTHVRTLVRDGVGSWMPSIPWNPLPLSAPDEAESTRSVEATDAGSVSGDRDSTTTETWSGAVPVVSVVTAIGAMALLVLVLRRRRSSSS